MSAHIKRYYARGSYESRGNAYESNSIMDARAEAYRRLMSRKADTVFIVDTYGSGRGGYQIGFAKRFKDSVMIYIRPKYYGDPPTRRYLHKDGTLGKII